MSIDYKAIDLSKIVNYADVPDEIRNNVKPCPFCGSRYFSMTPPQKFNDSMKEFGVATLMFGCRECGASVSDSCVTESDYRKRLQIVLLKWETRKRREKM